MTALRSRLASLTKPQVIVVTVILPLSIILALTALWGFSAWNKYRSALV